MSAVTRRPSANRRPRKPSSQLVRVPMPHRMADAIAKPAPRVLEGGGTVKAAFSLVDGLREWARTAIEDPEKQRFLIEALSALRDTLMTGWTDVDEALVRLSFAEEALSRKNNGEATTHLAIAQKYLHRWQDRGGRIGNGGAR